MNICSNCGQKFEGNFCPNCGEKAKPAAENAQNVCPHCGAALKSGAIFCSSCGKRLSSAPQTARPDLPSPTPQTARPDLPSPVPANNARAQAGQTYAPPARVNGMPAPGAHGILPYPYAESKFTGGAFGRFGVNFLVLLVSVITLSLGLPAMLCFKQRYLASRTIINGRKLYFDGKALQLIGKYIVWLLLSIVTVGIYLLFLTNRMKKWVTSHRHFEGVQGGVSEFTGGAIAGFFVNFWALIVTIITLTFGAHWATCFKQRWEKKHTYIDGHRLYFDGKALQLFGKRICWGLLTVITVGIFFFWYKVRVLKWITSHTHADPALDPKTAQQAVPANGNIRGISAPSVSPSAPSAQTMRAQGAASIAAGSAGAASVQNMAAVPKSNASGVSLTNEDTADLDAIRTAYPEMNVIVSDFSEKAEPEQVIGAAPPSGDTAQTQEAASVAENKTAEADAGESITKTVSLSEDDRASDTRKSADESDDDDFDYVSGQPSEPARAQDTGAEELTENAAQASAPVIKPADSAATVQASTDVPAAKTVFLPAKLLFALPAAAFLLLSILCFLFMTASVSPELFGMNYYEIGDIDFAKSAAAMSIACTSLLLVFSVLYAGFAVYCAANKKDVRAGKIPFRFFFDGICALLALLVFVAACMVLGELGKYEAKSGAAPVLCLVFVLLFLAGIAVSEFFYIKKFSAQNAFTVTSASDALNQARTSFDKKFLHPDIKDDKIFAIEKQENDFSEDHKTGEALAYANKGAAGRKIWAYVLAIIFLCGALIFAVCWFFFGETTIGLFIADLIFLILLLSAASVCLHGTLSERKCGTVNEKSTLAFIKQRKNGARKLAVCNAALAVIAAVGMAVLNAAAANALLTYSDSLPVIFLNFYFLRSVSNGLGEFPAYYIALFLLFTGVLKAFADFRRCGAYAFAYKKLSKTLPNENTALGARWAMLKNALRENELAAKKKIKYTKDGKQERTLTPRLKRSLATALSAVLALVVLLCVMPAVQNSNDSLGNVTNLVLAYREQTLLSDNAAEILWGEPIETDGETYVYYSKNYLALAEKAESLEEKADDNKISMEKYFAEIAKLSAKLENLSYRRVTISDGRVYSELIRSANDPGEYDSDLDWVKTAVGKVKLSSSVYENATSGNPDKSALAQSIVSELNDTGYYTAKCDDGSIEVADLEISSADIISVSGSSVRMKITFFTSFGVVEKTIRIKIEKSIYN